jgi:hypothetical protein
MMLQEGGHGCVNSPGVPSVVDGVVSNAVVVVGTVGVVQSLSSSGQSSTPSHQDVALMQMLLVGHRTVPDGQGLQMHPHEGVNSLCRPYDQNTSWLICLYPFRYIHKHSLI